MIPTLLSQTIRQTQYEAVRFTPCAFVNTKNRSGDFAQIAGLCTASKEGVEKSKDEKELKDVILWWGEGDELMN